VATRSAAESAIESSVLTGAESRVLKRMSGTVDVQTEIHAATLPSICDNSVVSSIGNYKVIISSLSLVYTEIAIGERKDV
jgi:hypothetical protein